MACWCVSNSNSRIEYIGACGRTRRHRINDCFIISHASFYLTLAKALFRTMNSAFHTDQKSAVEEGSV